MQKLPQLTCRKCSAKNPMIYYAPITHNGKGTCIFFNCVKSRNWLDKNENLKKGIEL